MCPGPSIITCTSCAHAFSVSSPRTVELGELRAVVGVRHRARAEPVPQRQRHVVAARDLEHPVEVGIERVLLVVRRHPVRVQRAAARHDPCHPAKRVRHVLAQHARVDGHVVHALPRLMLHHIEQVVGGEVLDLAGLGHRLVDRHRADRHRRGVDDRRTDRVDVPARREVHDGVGAVVHGVMELLELPGDVRGDGGVADVGVDLHPRHLPDPHRIEPLGEVLDVGGNHEAPAGDFVAHELGIQLFPLGDPAHLVGDHALAGVVHLGVAVHIDSPRRHYPDQVQRVCSQPAKPVGLAGTPVNRRI